MQYSCPGAGASSNSTTHSGKFWLHELKAVTWNVRSLWANESIRTFRCIDALAGYAMQQLAGLNISDSTCFIAGDWNFVVRNEDRINKIKKCLSGQSDASVAEFWKQIEKELGLREIAQDSFTFTNKTVSSKIDRVYTNIHCAVQVIHKFFADILDRQVGISDHFPLVFGMRCKQNNSCVIPSWIVKHPGFVDEFRMRWEWQIQRLRECRPQHSPFEILEKFKSCAVQASRWTKRKLRETTASSLEERLAVTNCFVHSVLEGQFQAASQIATRYRRLPTQGCPLSPLLFALATDSLLRKLQSVMPTELDIVRAFADDIAAVCSDWCNSIPFLSVLFAEFEKISALSLNIAKTVFIPLWDVRDWTNVRKLVQEHCPAWKLISIAHFARYLGFLVGPAADSHQWDAPLQKFLDRLYKWSALPVGCFLRLKMFKTFSLSTLSFVMQLVDLPPNINDIQNLCVRKLFPGPGNWISIRDAQHLHRKWHFPIELDDFHILSLAIRVRTWRQVGARCEEAVRELDGGVVNCPFPTWFSASFYRILWKAILEVRSRGIDLEGLLLQISNQWSFQKALIKALKQKTAAPYCPMLRLQDKFERWRLSERGNIACRRALRCLQHISKHSRPAVVIAILRVWFNGWPTARRMRNMLPCETTQRCKLGCQHCDDSIEHYACCRVFWKFCCSPLPHGLGIASRHKSKETFFMVNYDLCENDILKLAHAIHALQNFLVCTSHVEAPSNRKMNKVLMLLVKQAATGFNAYKEIFQPSHNATLYDIDMPILSQLGISDNLSISE
eukprot:s11_g45.t1